MRLSNVDLVNAWKLMPLHRRLAILAESVIENDRAATAVTKLVTLAAVMATHLTAEQRAAIARHMHREADALTEQLH